MRARVGARERIYLALLACAGTLAAHSIAYWVVASDAHHHASLLLDTGHGYWGVVTPVAMGLAVAGIAGALLSGSGRTARFMAVARRAVTLQAGAFLAMETVERASVGGPLLVVREPVVLVGLAVQVAIAFAIALLLVVLTRCLGTPAGSSALVAPPPVGAASLIARTPSRTSSELRYGGALLRAPPATS
ncbi:MAG: hypothetical protein ACRDK3_08670 [Actinomycetota bacterium]